MSAWLPPWSHVRALWVGCFLWTHLDPIGIVKNWGRETPGFGQDRQRRAGAVPSPLGLREQCPHPWACQKGDFNLYKSRALHQYTEIPRGLISAAALTPTD